MDLSALPAAPDPALESMLGFHRHAERRLAALGALPVQLECRGLDAEASASAAAILNCFGLAMAAHHAEEERDLLPLIERRVAAGPERERIREVRAQLAAEHREIERVWRELRRPLLALSEGVHRSLSPDTVLYFRALCTTHISAEEATLHLLALRHLHARDHAELERRLRERRARRLRAA